MDNKPDNHLEPFYRERRSLLAELPAAVEANDADRIRFIRERVDRVHWDALVAIVKAATARAANEALIFLPEEKDILDFGFYAQPQAPWKNTFRVALEDYRNRISAHSVVLMHEYLQVAYRRAVLKDTIEKTEASAARLREQLDRIPQQMDVLIKKRSEVLAAEFDAGRAAGFEKLAASVEKIYWKSIHMEDRVRRGGLSSKDERLEYVQIKEKLASALIEENSLLGDSPAGRSVRALSRKVEKAFHIAFEFEQQLSQVQAEIAALREKRVALTVPLIQVQMEDEIRNLQNFAKMAALRSRMPTFATLTEAKTPPDPAQIEEGLQRIEAFNPGLFINRMTKAQGRPSMVLFAGNGTGVYDWNRNRFLIPVQPAGNLIETLGYAAVTYWHDVDHQTNNGNLALSFSRDIRENAGVRSIRKIREKMVDAYIVWVTKEADGYHVLDPETRTWFEENIGPKKHHPIMPAGLSGLSTVEARDRAVKLETKPDLTASDHYELGIYYFLTHEYEPSGDHFEKAIKADPNLHEALYSSAMISILLHRRGAVERLTQFLKAAPQSWWTRKALEHLRNLK